MREVPKCSLVSARIAVTPREGTAPCGVTCDFAFFAPFPEASSGAQGACYSDPPVLSGPWRCARGLGAMASYEIRTMAQQQQQRDKCLVLAFSCLASVDCCQASIAQPHEFCRHMVIELINPDDKTHAHGVVNLRHHSDLLSVIDLLRARNRRTGIIRAEIEDRDLQRRHYRNVPRRIARKECNRVTRLKHHSEQLKRCADGVAQVVHTAIEEQQQLLRGSAGLEFGASNGWRKATA